MRIDPKIPVPVTFNPHKHHSGFLMDQVAHWKKMDLKNIEKEMRVIGTNLLDLYVGKLSVDAICSEAVHQLKSKNISGLPTLKRWMKPRNYRKIVLSDKSVWVVKEGINNKRYIHIHPAKDSPKSIRVRGTTLKTVLALKIEEISGNGNSRPALKTVNKIRKEYFALAPVRALQKGKGILRLWNYFNSPTS